MLPAQAYDTPAPSRLLIRHPRLAERKAILRAAAAPLFAAEGGQGLTFSRLVAAAGLSVGMAAGLYASCQEVLADLVFTHLLDLTRDVGAAHDAVHAPGSALTPEGRLEALLRAFLDALAARPHEHRAFLFCVHRLDERDRASALLRYQIVLEMIRDALAVAIPALAGEPRAAETLLGTIRTLLSDPWRWPLPHSPEHRQAEARRMTGMLLAAATAESEGVWPALGGVAGAEPGIKPLTLDVRTARARFSEMLKAAELGADIVLTRRGRRVARVVAVG